MGAIFGKQKVKSRVTEQDRAILVCFRVYISFILEQYPLILLFVSNSL